MRKNLPAYYGERYNYFSVLFCLSIKILLRVIPANPKIAVAPKIMAEVQMLPSARVSPARVLVIILGILAKVAMAK